MSEFLKPEQYSEISRIGDEYRLKLELLAYRNKEKTIDFAIVANYLTFLSNLFNQSTKEAWQQNNLRLNINWFVELAVVVRPKANKSLLLGETRNNKIGIYSAVVDEIPQSDSFEGELVYWEEFRNCLILQRQNENYYESDWVMLKSTDGESDFEVIDIKPKIDQRQLTNIQNNDILTDMNKSNSVLTESKVAKNAAVNGTEENMSNKQLDDSFEATIDKQKNTLWMSSKDPVKAGIAICDIAESYLNESNAFKEVNPIKSQELFDEAKFWLEWANDYEEQTDQDQLSLLKYPNLVNKAISLFRTDQLKRSDLFIDFAKTVDSFDSINTASNEVISDLPDPKEAYDIAVSYLKMAEDSKNDDETRIEYTYRAEKWLDIFNDLKTKAFNNAKNLHDKADIGAEDINTRIGYSYEAKNWLDKSEIVDKKELNKPGFTNKIKRIGLFAIKAFKPKKA